jgi:hypothetical protein
MQNTNPLDFDQSSTYTDICLAIIDRMCFVSAVFLSLFQEEKGVDQYNTMRKSGLRVRRGWTLSFL